MSRTLARMAVTTGAGLEIAANDQGPVAVAVQRGRVTPTTDGSAGPVPRIGEGR